ncbi:MAG: membrane protein [Acidobacteriota bacterium]
MTLYLPRYGISQRLRLVLAGLMALGGLTFLAGLILVPGRIWANYLISFFYLLSLGLGAAFFIALQYASGASFGVAYRRIPEAMTSVLKYSAAGLVLLLAGVHSLYEWSHPSVVAGDAVLQEKSAWLNVPFFTVRLALYFLVWIGFSRALVRNSLRQDTCQDPALTFRNVRLSAAFLLLGGITFILASFDLLMSLQPHWQSTIFGLTTLAGMFVSGLAAVTMVMVLLRRSGYGEVFTRDHLAVMGKWLLAMSVFWMYLWVSQHLLIWYSNIPEETSYYVFRHFGSWGSISFLNLVMNWLVPFLVLLPRFSKRDDQVMFYTSGLLLAGHWVDLYIMVMPVSFGPEPQVGGWEIGMIAGTLALFFWVTLRTFGRRRPVPLGDPYLVESLPELLADHR